ncbi:MAG: phosphate ABC transporter ATP-binding protein PstB [Chloroflexi bacterium]|nr:phosphate ABC transporter ATP-binding protein PstB [Chloroflexota bacterium]MCY3684942.1 phosphate ABC transporter ATP-binding protein PstB [Chloroflexota bacterium]MDE2707596.1 phosphate ABC transporter ATP-binding protein PstB [Chloroflexota bacterium]MDE2988669.1 phosphate ABC transporter ATP-binding protein PstB [Chloroflexota bacterium]
MARNFFTLMRSSAPSASAPGAATAERPAPPVPPNNMTDGADAGGGVHFDLTLEAVRHEINEEVDIALQLRDVSAFYGSFQAIDRMTMPIPQNRVTALIGPSGCGKSTLLRCFNRMNDLIPGARMEGEITFEGRNLLDPNIDAVEVRRRIGMVFQKPNPFPKSIYENVAFGARINGYSGDMDRLVEDALRRAALWDEVKDELDKSGLALSGGQQQRLCIARAIAVQPEIILMDEPASALDPVATLKIEDLMRELAEEYTIVVVTHNMQQAGRVSDYTAFLLAGEERVGRLVEFGPTQDIFTNPLDQRTEDYITGRYG